MKTLSDAILTSLMPNTYYRARDIADQMNIAPSTISASLRELSRGGG
jgi:Mn-dependent DtxR family transcriptional regulator